MSKEKDMKQPNYLGHYHRDIVKVIDTKPYNVKILMSCNHTTWVSLASYKKYKDDAHLCMTCSHLEEPSMPKEYPETHWHGMISLENKEEFPYSIIKGDLGIQIAKDGRVWVCIDGIAFIRFKPTKEKKS